MKVMDGRHERHALSKALDYTGWEAMVIVDPRYIKPFAMAPTPLFIPDDPYEPKGGGEFFWDFGVAAEEEKRHAIAVNLSQMSRPSLNVTERHVDVNKVVD
jgi:hypothetical protein